jgi:hypothetical protein
MGELFKIIIAQNGIKTPGDLGTLTLSAHQCRREMVIEIRLKATNRIRPARLGLRAP